MSRYRRGTKIIDAGSAGGKTASELAESAFSASYKADPGAIVRAMPRSAFFKNLKLPEFPLKTSSILDTGKLLKKAPADLIPKKTSDLITSVSKSVDDVPIQSLDDVTKALKKVNVDDVSSLVKTANKSSLGKLKDISTRLAKNVNNRTKFAREIGSSATKKVDQVMDGKTYKKTDDMVDAMKNSKKGSKYIDEAAELSAKTGKNKALRLTDDLAEKAMDALKFAKKHEGKLTMGIFGAYLVQEYINGNLFGDLSSEQQLSDPGDADVASAIEESSAEAQMTTIDESTLENNGALTSDSALLVIAALGIASVVI